MRHLASGIRQSPWIPWVVGAAIVVMSARAFYVSLFEYAPHNDFKTHMEHAQLWLGGGPLRPNFGYQLLLNVLTAGSGNLPALQAASATLATAAVGLKLLVTARLVSDPSDPQPLSPLQIGLVLGVAALVAPIVVPSQFPRVYLGQLTPNIWHNPTTIVAMPMWLGVMLMLRDDGRRGGVSAAYGSLMLLGSTLIKPNFALVLLPVMALFCATGHLRLRTVCVYALPTVVCLLGQLYVLRTSALTEAGAIGFGPFALWRMWSLSPLRSALFSIAFPGAILLCFGTRLRRRGQLTFCWLLLACAVAQFVLFAETGERTYHGNFFWGVVPAMYLLFLVSFVELLQLRRGWGRGERVRLAICWLLLAAHLASGVLFYMRTLDGLDYRA